MHIFNLPRPGHAPTLDPRDVQPPDSLVSVQCTRVLAKTVRVKKIVYRDQRIPFVTNIYYQKVFFALISASVCAGVIDIFFIGTGEVWGPLPVQGGGQPSGRQACSEAGQGVCWDMVDIYIYFSTLRT